MSVLTSQVYRHKSMVHSAGGIAPQLSTCTNSGNQAFFSSISRAWEQGYVPPKKGLARTLPCSGRYNLSLSKEGQLLWSLHSLPFQHLEKEEQLCKSSLQCLISTNCISLSRPGQTIHVGTLIAGILVPTKPYGQNHVYG